LGDEEAFLGDEEAFLGDEDEDPLFCDDECDEAIIRFFVKVLKGIL
jgi:hypothetical protein